MQLEELLKILSDIAPLSLAEQWDNPGLLVEPLEREIKTALVALDCTVDVVQEAKERGAQIVLAHHPLFFKPAQSLFTAVRKLRPRIGLRITASVCMRRIPIWTAHGMA
jgi:putative NIF3 family GTP cyclohydrolase 1 type 2